MLQSAHARLWELQAGVVAGAPAGSTSAPKAKPMPTIQLLRNAQAKARALILLNRQIQQAEAAAKAEEDRQRFLWANRLPPPPP